MRENRPYGSEGGARFYSSLLPLSSESAIRRFHTGPCKKHAAGPGKKRPAFPNVRVGKATNSFHGGINEREHPGCPYPESSA